jgi:sulfate permease, SulP family
VGVVIQYSISLALVGIVESVLTLNAMDALLEEKSPIVCSHMETFAQGVGNFICGIFSALGGDAMIGESTVNLLNGSRGRLSSISAGIWLILMTTFLGTVIESLPIATLTGIIFMVVIHTFYWKTFALIFKIPWQDSFIIAWVTVMSVLFDLAISVISGVVWASLFHSWDVGQKLTFSTQIATDSKNKQKRKIYKMHGKIFFGNAK